MNFKKIADVPVLEEILEGDMLVVNHGGTAAQIDASKVGGAGEGGDIPLLGATENFVVIDYATKEPVDFATGLDILTKRPILRAYAEDMPETMAMFFTVLMMDVRTGGKYANAVIATQSEGNGTLMDVTLAFSDSAMD